MADRMTRMWAPMNVQPGLAMAAGAVARVNVLNILETSLGRSLRAWTVTRFICNLQFTSNDTSFQWGLRVENENVILGSIDPEADSTADWISHGGMYTNSGGANFRFADAVKIDNRSQRKSHGEQSDLFFYVENTGLVGGSFTLVGRVLLLLP